MCEFCKYGERNSIVDNDPNISGNGNIIIREHPEFWIQEAREEYKPDSPILICEVRLGIKDSTYDNAINYNGIPIKYCPICGRKLEIFE